MKSLKVDFEEIKKSKNSEDINNFLIKLSNSPSRDHLNLLEFFISNLNPEILDKIKINLIFTLGEIGKSNVLNEQFLSYIVNSYYTSDRWVRNEIIQTIGKISKHAKLSEELIKLIGSAVNDEYIPIKKNTLGVLLKLEKLPNLKNMLRVLGSKNTEVVERSIEVLFKFIPNSTQLFDSLNSSDNYQFLKIKGLRTILLFYFKSIIDLESFREKILNSTWEKEKKEDFLKEIEFYERILLK